MKKSMILAFVFCLLAIVASAMGQENEPGLVHSMDLGFAKLKLRGLVQAYGYSTDGQRDLSLTNFRLSSNLTGKSGRWGTELLINFAQFQEETSKNYLMLANAWYKVDENWKLRVGRFFAAGGFTTPIAALNETVSYPNCDPTGSFIWGAQVEYSSKDEDGWLIMADVGGRSVVPFDSEENWRGLEVSARLQKNFGKSWLAGTLQCSEDYKRFAIDANAALAENLYLRSAIYFAMNDSRTSDLVGGYTLAAWEPLPRVEIHGMIDWWSLQAKSWVETQFSVSDKGEISIDRVTLQSATGYEVNATAGLRFWLDQKRTTTLTLDAVKTIASSKQDLGMESPVKIEARFSFWW
jgi:hypothetical protein